MVQTGFSTISENLHLFFLGIILCQNIINISGTIFSLTLTYNRCSDPIPTWLICHSSVVFSLFILCAIFKNIGYTLWILWNIVWAIIGSIWVFGSEDCLSMYEIGYVSSAVMITVSYFIIGMILTVSLFFCVMMLVGYCLSNKYRELSD
ncbi:hypothetical protein SteCoe_24980 [Stentor coeruleus]|uniref:MARVEL domain-containing protein n=1 Tax=Stentor coeruleus TaxID=5963 RepID=A0A1R2BGC8_9CILI|nr:hypothetical protein SteCoe_24980 [Stentor coeruleus]